MTTLCSSSWLTTLLKGAPFLLVFGGVMLAFEGREILEMIQNVRRAFARRSVPVS